LSAPPAWLSVAKPEPELPAETVFHIFGFPISNTIVTAWFTILFLFIVSLIATRKIKIVPERMQNVLEFVIEALLNFCQRVAGEKNGRRFFPIVATIFLFVIFNAWLALLPIFGTITIHTEEGMVHLLRPANTDINMPLALAIVSFIAVAYFGLKDLGTTYVKTFFNFGGIFRGIGLVFTGKILPGFSMIFRGVIDAFIGLVEFLSRCITIVSFTFRLFGNMTAGEILLLSATFMLPFVFADVFYTLELLFSFVQALIFAGLTLIFLTLAVSSHDEEHHDKKESVTH
jgi:F-type H+-transporting ATPase subunit a